MEEGVEGHIDADAKRMGELHEAGNVLHTIARCGPRPEAGSTDIDSIGTVADGFHATFKITGRRQEFDCSHYSLFFLSRFIYAATLFYINHRLHGFNRFIFCCLLKSVQL